MDFLEERSQISEGKSAGRNSAGAVKGDNV
jgi:hypothetical protein